MNEPIKFTVFGVAQPAGSKRGFVIRSKATGKHRAILTDANPNSRVWKEQVASAIRAVYTGPLLDGPLELIVKFYRPRPKGHFGAKGMNKQGQSNPFPASAPDTTKLIRGIEDALNKVLWTDDSRVVRQVATKEWGEPARAEIQVVPMF